jgi:hypothetical protein
MLPHRESSILTTTLIDIVAHMSEVMAPKVPTEATVEEKRKTTKAKTT